MKPTSTRTAGIVAPSRTWCASWRTPRSPSSPRRSRRALHARGEIGCFPLRGAALDVVEHERDLRDRCRARRHDIAAERATVDVDAARGEHERLVAALGAGRRRVGMDADEQVGRELRSATATRWRSVRVRSPVRVSSTRSPLRAEAGRRRGSRSRASACFSWRPCALRAAVRAAVTGVEDDDVGRGGGAHRGLEGEHTQTSGLITKGRIRAGFAVSLVFGGLDPTAPYSYVFLVAISPHHRVGKRCRRAVVAAGRGLPDGGRR